jgi:hypothetical protein
VTPTFICEVATGAAAASVYDFLSSARGLLRWWSVRLEDDLRVGAIVDLPLADASLRFRADREARSKG